MFPERLERKVIYESSWINLYVDRVLMPSGHIVENYHQLDYPQESITVLLFNAKREICFIESLRYTTQQTEWELPSGGMECDEDIFMAAQREVREETGFSVKNLQALYVYNPSSGMSNQRVHILVGDIEDEEQTAFDTDEVKAVHWFSSDEVRELLIHGKVNNGITLIAVLFWFGGFVSALEHGR